MNNNDYLLKNYIESQKRQKEILEETKKRRLKNKNNEEQAKNLLKQHSESPPEQLLKMSHKYKVLLDSIQKNMHMIDQRMLSQFSKDQYNLYIKLCNQVSRTPIFAEPQVNEK